MDLELTDEQTWLSESLETLLGREWTGAEAAHAAGRPERDAPVVGARGVRRAERGPGGGARRRRAVPRGAGPGRAPGVRAVPRQRRAALRGRAVLGRGARGASRTSATIARPSRCWSPVAAGRWTGPRRPWDSRVSTGARWRSSTPTEVDRFAVVASAGGTPGAGARRRGRAGRRSGAAAVARRDASRCTPSASPASSADAVAEGDLAARAARAADRDRRRCWPPPSPSGAAGRLLDDACAYAAERRQFGRTIGSYQALRHILADMYVRQASAWSTVLYAAAALDDDLRGGRADGRGREGVRRPCGARGGARRAAGLRRHRLHPGAPGAPLPAPDRRPRAAVRRRRPPRARARPSPRAASGAPTRRLAGPDSRQLTKGRTGMTTTPETGFNDPTAQRLERISTGADPDVVGPLLADVLHDPRWLTCDVALISGGKSNLTYRVASRRRRGDPAAPAARAHPSHGA